MKQTHYIEITKQRVDEALLILRHIGKLLKEGGFIDTTIRSDFLQSLQSIYNISLFMRWQKMEQIALKLLELAEKLKDSTYDKLVLALEQSTTLLRQIRIMVEHIENYEKNKKGKLAAL